MASISDFLKEWRSALPYVTAHTSGSTGVPKEIRLLKSDMERSARATCRFFNIGPKSTLLLPLSPDYIAGKMMIVRAEVSGANLIAETPSMMPLQKDYGVDIDLLPIVPSQLSGVLASPYIRRVKALLAGGAPLSPAQEEATRNAGIPLYASYGMTETCSHVALRNVTAGEEFFTFLPGITGSTDSRGCLVLGMPGFSFGKLVTNDIVELSGDSTRFRWLGRFDNVIISGGVKLHPEEIEHVIAPLFNQQFFIAGRPDDTWGTVAVLCVEGTVADTEQLTAAMRRLLPPRSVPKEIISVPEFARTSSGKVIRRLP